MNVQHLNRVIITGGAGFIGSHVLDYLVGNALADEIIVIDNLSSGSIDNVAEHINKKYFIFEKADLKLINEQWFAHFKDVDMVIHMAANPEVRVSVTNPYIHFNENLVVTFNVLEACRRGDAKALVFASSSTVYGDARIIPTPENYQPLEPISVYGAVKLAAEYLCITYSKLYGIKSLIVRYANIIGPRSSHGVIVDFINKLRQNPSVLEILGDGTQKKSYLHVYDAVSATVFLALRVIPTITDYDIYNVGNDDWITVKEIADIVVEEMGLSKVNYVFRPATADGRGWPGDVKLMLLDISKLKSRGWKPLMNSYTAVRKTVRQLLKKEI
ncbi:MAG: NAD-dependent epimerase/dehydratase family protein [Ignisphaera sp.]|nr:NAD-dependent epimerase/dehydratase family protein [Ignisphaera sp.]MCX8167417.1 NAD-dependent epimerase/dehydratase family protein [Ignisphaera sp.]MDW8085927.1 NAD-dependent epimerase/dehydratase family protein [Ignisphaera sp.]